jgi:hypothetical protein
MRRIKRYWNKLVAILLACTFGTLPVTVHGFDATLYNEAVSSGNLNTLNPLAWQQCGAVPPGQDYIIPNMTVAPYTIGMTGCTYFAHYYMMIRAGLKDPEKDGDIVKFIKELAPQTGMGFFPESTAITTWFPQITCVADINDGGKRSIKELKTVIKEVYDRGNFLVVEVFWKGYNTGTYHCVYVEGLDEEGNIQMVDSSTAGSNPLDPSNTGYSNYLVDENSVWAYRTMEYHVEGVDSRETKTLWDRYGDGKMEGFSSVDLEQNSASDLSEEQLEGMQQYMENYAAYYQHFVGDISTDDLALVEQQRLAALKADIEADKTETDYVGVAISAAGLLMMLYAILLVLAYFNDMAWPFWDGSLVSTLTFGKIRLSASAYSTVDSYGAGHHFMSTSRFAYTVISIFVVGIILATGWAWQLMLSIWNGIVLLIKSRF